MSDQPVIEIHSWESPFGDEHALTGLSEILPGYISGRRWYRAKARTIERITVHDVMSVADSSVFILVVRIEYKEGAADDYFVPVAVARPGAAAVDEPVCGLRGPDGREGVLYGVLSNAKFRQDLLDLITCDGVFEGWKGNLVGRRMALLDEAVSQLESVVSRAEQSNTSIIYGNRYILKLFRKLEAGVNPDIEIGSFLTQRGFKNTPAVLGHLEYNKESGESCAAGILQQFVRNEGDAWTYTLKSLAGFFERALTGAQDLLGDYAGSAALLGKRTAEMHAAFEDENAGPDFIPESFTSQDGQKLYQDLLSQADIAFEALRRKQPIIRDAAAESAREVLRRESEVVAKFDALRQTPVSAIRIRHHGDYHLGQVLYTGSDFMIIDFEGEPARPLSERRRKALAMRDVAGMVRSFQYAAYSAMFEAKPGSGVESWTEMWTQQVSTIYLNAYFSRGRGLRCIPSSAAERQLLLDAFLLQKALYEVAYELNNRPDWVLIPLRGILSLMN